MADPELPLLPDLLPGFSAETIEIVDLGAMMESEPRHHRLVTSGAAHLTGFEPNRREWAKLQAFIPGGRFLPYFVGTGKPATLYTTAYPGCSSLYEPDPRVIDGFDQISTRHPSPEGGTGNFCVVGTEAVETRKLDDIEECPAPDLLKLDVQGSELDVLRNGEGKLASALVVEVEVEFVELYKGQPLFGDIHRFLADRGLVFHKLVDLGGRTFRPIQVPQVPRMPMSQLLWADAVFVRSLFDLSQLDESALAKLAAILHGAYRSFDLVHRVLMELDLRTGATHVPAYQDFLRRTSWDDCLICNFKA